MIGRGVPRQQDIDMDLSLLRGFSLQFDEKRIPLRISDKIEEHIPDDSNRRLNDDACFYHYAAMFN
jgi:hypothetical protein